MTYGQYGKPKQCQNNCGQEIAWDKQAGYFINTSNSTQHVCPKWEKKPFTPNTPSSGGGGGSQESVTTQKIDQVIELLTAIKEKVEPIPKIEQGVSMGNWMHEKVAKKIGVDDLLNDTSK